MDTQTNRKANSIITPKTFHSQDHFLCKKQNTLLKIWVFTMEKKAFNLMKRKVKESYSITFKKDCGNAKAVDANSDNTKEYFFWLEEILSQYTSDNILNAHETGLFYLLHSNETLEFNSLPNNKVLDFNKLKAFADMKLNIAKMMISVFDKVENFVGNRENAGYHHFLLFPTMFSKAFFFRVVKI